MLRSDLPLELKEMVDEFENSSSFLLLSKYWIKLNERNYSELHKFGYKNFKRTIVLTYFTWTFHPQTIPHIYFLIRNVSISNTLRVVSLTISSKVYPPLNKVQSYSYTFITLLLWEYVKVNDKKKLFHTLEEPKVGNPPRLNIKGRLISQDLLNSYLEFNSIMNFVEKPSNIKKIIELGPGYGRNAYVFLKLIPNIKYILVDIPPALFFSQQYLSEVFPDKKIFKFRKFSKFSEIKTEFENSDIIFLLPHQLSLLPRKYCDLFLNIASLHEMTRKQINYYIKEIDRLTKKYFYFKEWHFSIIPYDNILITKKDYHIPSKWKKIYWRTCKIQNNFFEALYKLPSK